MASQGNPFKPEDLDEILKEETSSSEGDGWQLAKKTDLAEIWSRDDPSSSVKLVKAFLQFPNIPVADIIELLYNLDVRRRWDKDVTTAEVVEDFGDYKLIYWVFKMPTGVSNRDLLQYATVQKDEGKNLHYILYKNATDERRPEVPGVVRAKTIVSGLILRPDENDSNSTKMSFITQTDLMGMLPSFVTNMATKKSLVDWRDTLSKFYDEVYSKEKS